MTDVRPAQPSEVGTVANVIDGAGLTLAYDRLVERIRAGSALVATGAGAVPVGAIVLTAGASPAVGRVLAVAVRRRRRGQGVGTGLVRAATARYPRLLVAFDASVRPFYRELGFRITQVGPDRYRGELRSTPGSARADRGAHSDARGVAVVARPP